MQFALTSPNPPSGNKKPEPGHFAHNLVESKLNMSSKQNKSAPTSPYTANRRVQFRDTIMPGIQAGDAKPKFLAPIAQNEILENQQLTFVGGSTTNEPKLQHACHHDLWVLSQGTRLIQVYAVYGNKDGIGLSRKGKNRSFGISPALTEARQRAVDMGVVAYSVLEAHAGLEFTDNLLYGTNADEPMTLQLALVEVEETVLREALERNRLLQGFLAMSALVSSCRLNREQKRAMDDCRTSVQDEKLFNKLMGLIAANAACNRTQAPSADYVRNTIQTASSQTSV